MPSFNETAIQTGMEKLEYVRLAARLIHVAMLRAIFLSATIDVRHGISVLRFDGCFQDRVSRWKNAVECIYSP